MSYFIAYRDGSIVGKFAYRSSLTFFLKDKTEIEWTEFTT